MYLTRAEVSVASRNIASMIHRASARDAGHGLIWSLFERQTEGPARFLWRELEPGKRYLVLSPDLPEPAEPGLWALEPKPFAPAFVVGDRIRFSLRANPTKTLRGGVRVDVVMHARSPLTREQRAEWTAAQTEAAALDWLFAHADSWGLAFDADECMAMSYRQWRLARRGDRPVRFSTVDYQGAATVTEPAKLAAAVAGGVGRAKRYGCGLLLIRPA